MSEEYSKVLDEGIDYQIRLMINSFRDVEYLHIRKYYQDFEGEWLPTREGYAIPLTIEITRNLFEGLLEILAKAESSTLLEEHFGDLIHESSTRAS